MPEAISNTSPLLYLYCIIEPIVARLDDAGLWLSEEIQQRLLALAGER